MKVGVASADIPSISEIIMAFLRPPEDEMPIFWLDSKATFEAAVPSLSLSRVAEPLTSAFALDIRLAADNDRFPLRGRLFYLVDREALEPIAEVAHCFGIIKTIEPLEILRKLGIAISPEVVELVRRYAGALFTRWDTIPKDAFADQNLLGGLAAAVYGLSSVDPIDIALAALKSSGAHSSPRLGNGNAVTSIAIQERAVIAEYLSTVFGISAESELIKVAVLADLVRSTTGEALVGHLLPAEGRELPSRLANRLADDGKLLLRLRSPLEHIVGELGIDLSGFPLGELIGLRLIPNAGEAIANRVTDEISKVAPIDALAVLRKHAEAINSTDALVSFRSPLHCIDQMDQSATDLAARKTDPDWYFDRYTQEWYKVDEYYRKSMESASGGLRTALDTRYRAWLRESNSAFAEALNGLSTWHFSKSQRALGKTFIAVAPKTAVVVLDALRYEMACDVLERLPKSIEWERDWAVATLPSITEVGMSALVPAHDLMHYSVSNKKLKVYIGQRETTTKSARDAIWESENFHVAAPADVPMLSDNFARVVVFHGAVDALGEKLQGESFGHFAQLIIEIAQLLRELVSKGYEVLVTADHGFLTLPTHDASGRIEVGVHADEVKKRRYRVATDETLDEPIITRTAGQLGVGGDVEIGFAPAASVMTAYGALTFLHGGISLQEMVIPYFKLKAKAKRSARIPWKVDFPKRLLARTIRVTLEHLDLTLEGSVLELSVWRGGERLVAKSEALKGGRLTLSCLLPEELPAGPIRVKVGIQGAATVAEADVAYEPQRD